MDTSSAGRRGVRTQTPTAKIMPAQLPSVLVDRPELRARLDEVTGRRLTTVVAGAGFGKSTLLAGWALGVRPAWYALHPEDEALATFLPGLLDALRLQLPGLPAGVSTVLGRSLGPDVDDLVRADDVAAVLGELLDRELRADLVLVIDDVHELPPGGPSARLLEGLCRHAPPGLHIVLVSRVDPPFPVSRLRGRGQLLELDGALLRFTEADTARLLAGALGPDAARLAGPVWEMTGGWPAATCLAAEALRLRRPAGGPADHAAGLAALNRPGGPLFAYLAEEAFSQEDPGLRELVRRVAPLPRFSAGLCAVLGLDWDAAALAGLARRGLFVEPAAGIEGWFSLGSLVREFALRSMPLAAGEHRDLHRRAAGWFVRTAQLDDALACVRVLGAEPTAAFLTEHGPTLLAGGAADRVVAAAAALPARLRSSAVEALEGQARQVGGDWQGALACFRRAAPGDAPIEPGLAWRMGLIHYLRDDLDEALATYRRARPGGPAADRALLAAWTASVHWLRGELAECRAAAQQSHTAAVECGTDEALAAAHTILAMLAALEGDRAANDAHYLRALEAAERAGDVLQLTRIRTNRGSQSVEEANYPRAVAELEIAIRLAELNGFAAVLGIALSNRGDAYRGLGRLDEAIADLEASRAACQRAGSGMVAYPLTGLGDVYRERGDLSLARAAYAEAIRVSERANDVQGLVPALSGQAQALVGDDPKQAQELAARAVEAGPGMGWVGALLAAGWVALAVGDPIEAQRRAVEATEAAGARRDRAGLAGALELRALAAPQPGRELGMLREAAEIWAGVGNRVSEARVALALARLAGDPVAAGGAERRLRALGVRAGAAAGAGLLRAVAVPAGDGVRVQALGGFRVLRGGVPVRLEEWQSKKARDLLKVLVARRGRATPRELLAELLWPGEEPDRVGNRLSVALSITRAVLDPERRQPPDRYLVADKTTVRLGDLPVDVEEFLAAAAAGLAAGSDAATDLLTTAEAGYPGDFLEEDPYEDWAAPLREEARAGYLAVARALAGRAAAAGEHDLAVRYHLRVLERDPYDEAAHLGLVVTLTAAGRHGEARRRYRFYAERMDEIAVETEPFPATAGHSRP
jgi:ATP/maltotriose-dependent transcriptional regulator MalT/DNA-binding SARP family transcriptional activator